MKDSTILTIVDIRDDESVSTLLANRVYAWMNAGICPWNLSVLELYLHTHEYEITLT